MSLTRRKPPPPKRDRSAEFASFEPWRPKARMARADDPPRTALVPVVAEVEVLDPVASSAAGAAYMGRVALLPCVLCRLLGRLTVEVQVHHLRYGAGGAQRASDFLTMPLCHPCHQGEHGVHGDRGLLRQAQVTELDLLAETVAQVVR